jgi:cation diffusion facilitator CzcD-associated flavoprotein CzcO
MVERNLSLNDLAVRARYELECLAYPAREWVKPRVHDGTHVYDAVIVGGGQSGVSIAFRLLRERVSNILVLDRNEVGREGPWITFARMQTLRTPKAVIGPELGIPSLSVRAWWEVRFGAESWQRLDKIPRELWHDYLHWLRQTVGVEVANSTEVTDIEPLPDGILAVHTLSRGRINRLLTRNVVLATGIEGSGQWSIPEFIRKALPRDRYAHTADEIDFSRLAGKRVAVLGAGASAFDNAAMVLEGGAASVDLFVRRRAMPTVNPNRWMEFAGFLRHFGDLDDAMKWKFMKTIFDMNQPPPQDTFERCRRHSNFYFHLACPIKQVSFEGGQILFSTRRGAESFDFLIVGTGFVVDLHARPELRGFADRIALWSDRYNPPEAEKSHQMAGYPYLSGSFQFTEKSPGSAPFLKNVFSYTFAAMPSLAGSAGISALKFGVERIALGITRELFLDDAEQHLASLRSYDEPELRMTDLTCDATARPTSSVEVLHDSN